MRTTLNCAGLSAALLAVFITEPLLAGPPRSPYGGVPHPTYAGQRQRQQQANLGRYRCYSQRPSIESRQSPSHQQPAQVESKAGDRAIITGDNASVNEVTDAVAQLQPQKEATGPAKDANGSINAGREASSGSRHQGPCNVRTYRSTAKSSNSRSIPENLSTFRWGWWDLKDRW